MRPVEPSRPSWSFFVALFLAAFGLNWPWEIVQMPAYAETAGRFYSPVALAHIVPALGDVALTFAVYGVCALAAGRLRLSGSWNEYAAAALLGGAVAAAYEWKALSSGWWAYGETMPVVPLLGVGLWPLLQLTLLVPLALWLATWWGGRP